VAGFRRTPRVNIGEQPRFLIIRLGSLGDIVHGVPAAAALRRRYPRADIDWVVDPRYAELIDLVEPVDRAVPFDPRDMTRAPGRAARALRALRRAQYDAVVDLQGLLKSAALARLVGARRTIGFPRKHLREPLARLFYTSAPDPGAAAHVTAKNLVLLAPLDVTERTVRFPIRIPRTAAATAAMARVTPGPYGLINPGAAWPNKRWPPERFGAVAAALYRDFGYRSLVLWGPGEQSLAGSVASASQGAAEVAPPTTIPDVVAIARAARVMISGDTGPLHVAAAVDTPLVALFGPTRPERNGPWAPRDVVVSRVHQCQCLYERQCRRPTPCIEDIGVDEVVDAVRRRLSTHG
jgi:lipopolysaccharide heptosyltransferase I